MTQFLRTLLAVVTFTLAAQPVPAPAVLHSTFLGGTGPDYVVDAGLDVARGTDGTLFVLGQTSSSTPFPYTAVIGAQTNGYGSFVVRFSADGHTLQQATFIGGIAARAIAVDANGGIFLTGETGGALPAASSAQAQFGGAFDAFVLKLNPPGTEVVYATYLGGRDLDIGRDIAVDADGAAYICGWTSSTNFPATTGAAQVAIGGNYDAFVAKLAPDGSSLTYATYFGGARSETGASLALDAQRRVWLTGRTSSDDFPAFANPTRFGSSASTSQNAYVTRLSASGTAFDALATLSGDGVDAACKVALAPNGDVVLMGYTDSANLPVTPGVQQNTYRGADDLFVARFPPTLASLGFCTYLGSAGSEYASTGLYAGGYFVGDQFIEGTSLVTEAGGLEVDASGNIFVAAFTGAGTWPDADTRAPDGVNALVAKLSADGSQLLWLSLLGGRTEDYGFGLTVDGAGGAWVVGETSRPTLPPLFPVTSDAVQPEFGGSISDAFITHLGAPAAKPANDDFALSENLPLLRGSIRTRNVGASLEAAEPIHAGVAGGASLWWTWTAPTNGQLKLGTQGSSIDTLLAVYTGGALAGLVPVASNDDATDSTTSRVQFAVTAGTTYRLAVAGKADATGELVLNLAFSEPPNDDFANRIVLTGFPVTVSGSNRHATPEIPDDTALAAVPAGQSVWWEWTSPTNGFVAISTAGSTFNTLLGVFTGDALGSLTEVKSNDNLSDQPGALTSQVTFQATAGTRYLIAVDGYYGLSGDIQLGIFPGDPPLNDNFAQRAVLAGFFAQVIASNINATDEYTAGEPRLTFVDGLGQPLEPPAGYTVWWTWTAPTNGRARIGTSDVTFDTRLGVFTGSELNALTRIAANDNRGAGFANRSSLVTFEATAGTSYQILLDGGLYGGISGRCTLTLALERPPQIQPASLGLSTAGDLTFNVEAVPESTVHLEASDDFKVWTRLASRPVTEPVFPWTLNGAVTTSWRFFRLVDDAQ